MKLFTNNKRPIRFFGWGNKGHKRLGPDVENGKFKWADIILLAATLLLVNADKSDWLPEFAYKSEIITALALLLMLASFYSYYHKLCPMSKWRRSTWATGMTAITWAATPLLLYAFGINDNWQKMWHYSAWSAVMWVVFLLCLYKLYRVRQMVRAEIAMIEWRARTRRKNEL